MNSTLRRNSLSGLVMAAWMLVAMPVSAFPEDDGAMRLDAWLDAGVMDFDYEEFDQGASLDREEGYLPGVSAGLRLAQGRMFAETALEAWTGDVDYASATEITTTDEDILDWNILAGRDLFAQADQRLGLYAGLGYRHWQRDILSTPTAFGLDETYRWWYAIVGLRAESAVTPRVSFRADLQLRRTLDPQIDVRFKSGHDDITLELGEANGARAAFTLEGRADHGMTLFVTPWFEYWRLGRSANAILTQNGVPAGTVFEPRSRTHNLGINAGVRWQFF
ncbi:MAG TPA: hypothetical protein VM011_09765 [Gammaproteobacteria bacterium]|nr:hypothetical protein [Gammaproteobacteria bacterium]